MLPLRDRLPTRSFPFVNYLIVAANVLAWVWQSALEGVGYDRLGFDYGFIPAELAVDPAVEATHIFSSMFLHGGFAHLAGNMLFLWIFGDNVEDALGHLRYALFYVVGGVVAALTQFGVAPHSTVPMVGASGAIAAVLGAYVSLYPRAPVTVLNPIPLFWFTFPFIELPAWLVVLEWFVFENLLTGVGSLAQARGGSGGVAYFAHIGGFLAGLVLVRLFRVGRERVSAARWDGWRPPPRRSIGDPGRFDDPYAR